MSNETTTGAPLAATVGERLEKKAHEGDAAAADSLAEAGAAARGDGETGVDRAERAVAELQPGGERARAGREQEGERRGRRGAERVRPAVGRGQSGLRWAVVAGLGILIAVGWARRAFAR